MATALWTPDPVQANRTQMAAFMKAAGKQNYGELYDWSVTEPEAFWSALWEFTGVLGERGDRVLADGERFPGARWFPEARLNFAEHCLQRRDGAPALIYRREDGYRRALSWEDLFHEVGRLQGAFRGAGLQAGDRVAAILPNCIEAVCAMLAVTSLGGIWASASPDFGAEGILDRFGQIEPRFLIAVDAQLYKGVWHDVAAKLTAIQAGLPSLECCIVVRHRDEADAAPPPADAVDYVAFGDAARQTAPDFPRHPFAQPLYILFSSGTTGKPKCITHSAGGILLQHLKEHRLHTDLSAGDRLFYFTTTGWMMWNWLVTGLASGATLILYDGHPFHPQPRALWDLAQEEDFSIFGTSAKYLDACKKVGLTPRRTHDLASLRTILSTGSPLAPETFDYVYTDIKSDLLLASIAGGTDICSCFMLGCPVLPVHRGEIQCRGLGMKVEIFDDEGQSMLGRPGELVCTASAPAMPLGFWNDPDGARYRAAYFERFPGVWRHGDLVELRENGGLVIYGRSDATLNPGGVRIGTAEIYRQVEQIPEVEEAIAVGQDFRGDQRVLLFVKLVAGAELDAEMVERIRRQIRDNTTPRHVPAMLLAVNDIPRTRSGKISEVAVRDVIHGREVKNTQALANPEALNEFRDRSELSNNA